LNIGIIGIGKWGTNVYREYQNLQKNSIIDNVYSCDPLVESDYRTVKELLPIVDGVHICVPNALHYNIARQVINEGKHCLIEKPMTMWKQDAHKLIEIASEKGIVLQVGHVLRFANVLREAKKIINNKRLGKIRYGLMRWTNMVEHEVKREIIWELLPHPLDVIHYLFDEFPVSSNLCHKKVDDVSFCNLDYKDFFVNVYMSWLDPLKRRDVFLYGDIATLFMECVNQKLKIIRDGKEEVVSITPNHTIYDEAKNFVYCIENGFNRFNSHIIGLQNTECIENILKGGLN
jgi:predicted dehydrogenase